MPLIMKQYQQPTVQIELLFPQTCILDSSHQEPIGELDLDEVEHEGYIPENGEW